MADRTEEKPKMHIKSYFGASVEDAVEQAGRELGPDAVILSSRQAPPEAQHLGEYEVVFGLDRATDAPTAAPKTAEPRPRLYPRVGYGRRRGRPRARARKSSVYGIDSTREDLAAGFPDIDEALEASGVDAELAGVILRALEERAGAKTTEIRTLAAVPKVKDMDQLWDWLPEELAKRIEVNAEIGIDKDQPRVMALVGPAGVGKTTMIAKLACCYGLEAARPVQLISMDTLRIGAADQLHAYAAILGVGFQTVETARALEQALEEHRNKGLILIDTAGYSAATMADAGELTDFLGRHQEVDTHLVVSAARKTEDLLRTIERFEGFAPSKLMVTNLDETESLGSVYSAAVRSGLPISFLSNGQSVPEDLAAATREKIVGLVMPERPQRRAESAA